MSHRLGSGWADSFHAARLWISAAVVIVCACVALRNAVHGYVHHVPSLLVGTGGPVAAWWAFGAGLIFVGLIQAGAGLAALWSNPESKLASAFASFALASGLCLVTFFDAHGERDLVPMLALALASLPFAALRLVLHLPGTARVLARRPRFEAWLRGLGAAAGLGALVGARASDASRLLPWLAAWLVAGLGVLVVGLGVRATLATRGERPLTALLFGVVPPYVGVALCIALTFLGLRAPKELFYPCLALAPIGTLYAFARYDLWGSRALLSRLGTNVFLGAVAAAVAIAAGTAVATSVGASFHDALAGAAGSGVAAAVLVAFSLRLSDVTLFRSRAEYKPTIDRLSEELITLSSPSDVAHAIERTVRRWLRCDYIALSLAPQNSATVAATEERDAFHALTDADDEPPCSPKAAIRLVVSFGGRPYGWLDVGGKRGSALFTSDDIDLLRTVANHGGLALAHAHAYQELEDRRRRQAEAWRGEREALVETVAAEIAHEIRYPLNYFRSLFDRSSKNARLTPDDVDVGLEEVDRLERLVAGLKRMVAQRTERRSTHVAELCTRVEALLRDSLGRVRLELDIGADATLSCDPDKLTQVLVNLISNAVEACGAAGRVGIRWSAGADGGELSVWDDGPGFAGEASRLFAPWYTTKDRGTGLGLAITHRLVRAHGWTISAQRREGRTLFAIAVSATDIVRVSAVDRDSGEQVRVA